jgi:hypothetical protein
MLSKLLQKLMLCVRLDVLTVVRVSTVLFCNVSGRFFLKMEPSLSSKTSANMYQTRERHIYKGGVLTTWVIGYNWDILKRSAQNRVIIEKLIFAQLVKKFPIFHRIQSSSQSSQQPISGPYTEPVHCNPYFSTLFFKYIYTYLHCLRLGQPNFLFA